MDKITELRNVKKDLNSKSSAKRVEVLQKFFKTGKGEYGEGDIFIGVTVPDTRKIAKKYKDIPLNNVESLLRSEIHEERFLALLILVEQFNVGNESAQKDIYDFYLKNTKFINNWDLVDLSADKIIGGYLINKPKKILKRLAKSKNLWERRIAILATFHFIKNNKFHYALIISGILLSDRHDLIQKATGWMLREIGKRDFISEEKFLRKYHKNMSRTMLRYAIERFPEVKRLLYLHGDI